MLKRITVAFLILALLASNFSRFFIYAGYEMNRKYIAEKLCVNRDKPWLHCNGKCYFMKKIKQAQDKENSEEGQSQKNLFQEAFYAQPPAVKFHTSLLQVIAVPNPRINLPQIYNAIFRPPQIG